MELETAMKIQDLSVSELEQVLFKLRMQDQEAFDLFREILEDES